MKDFVLSQPEAYEIKIGNEVSRRPGDPPLEEVVEMLHREKNKVDDTDVADDDKHQNDEL